MTDITLIYLPKPFLKEPEAQAPLGLLYLSAMIELEGRYSVEYKNYSAHSEERLIQELPESILYGITVTSMEIPLANRVAKKIKKKFPKSKVILGGPGIYSFNVFRWIDRTVVDSFCAGEAESIINKIITDAKNGALEDFYYGNGVPNLDLLPFPSRHLINSVQGGSIFAFKHNYIGSESTVIISSRGCAFRCAFCSAPSLNQHESSPVRFRSPFNVYKEIVEVIKVYGIRQFRFSDDQFTLNKDRLIELCRLLKPLDIVWRISCRVQPLDLEMLIHLKEAGCKELSFGIESFDDNVLKGLKKGTTSKQNVRALELAYKVGMKTRMLFMIRTPFQTPQTIEINKHFIRNVPFDIIACTSFVPIPGSDIWENPGKYSIRILSRDLEKYNFYMYGPSGKLSLEPVIKIEDRPLEEFMQESEEFREWLQTTGKLNQG